MKKVLVSVLTVLISICIIAAAVGGFFLYRKYAPSKEKADPSDWFAVSGDRVALVLDDELDEMDTGRYIDGQSYLPLDWVNENLNERFYWDSALKQMIYTLPESIVYADTTTLASNGKPLIVEQDDQIWLMTGLVQTYTDIRVELFDDGEVKRAFVDTQWDPDQVAQVKKDGKVRVLGGVKSAILTEVLKGSEVVVLDTMENWSRVRTADGYLGYIQNKLLEKQRDVTLVSTFEEPVYTNISMDEPVSLVWHQVTTEKANQAMEQLMANTKGVNVIAPTWFMLTDNAGNYHSLADKAYVDKAHAMGLQVWGVLDNFNMGENVQSEVLFASTEARRKLIGDLMADVERYGLDGINLDIEGIKPSAGPHYVQFIRELSVDCRKNGIVLSVDTYVPSAYTAFYNRAEQGRVADYVIIMGYDEHYAGGEMGSVASLGYERKGIEDTMSVVPPEKIISAIPFYTRVWKETEEGVSSTAMGIAKAKEWVRENNVELYWQEELGQYYGELDQGDEKYYIWMEEEESIGKKMELIHQNNLAGVACWKLGFEPEAIWDVIHPE